MPDPSDMMRLIREAYDMRNPNLSPQAYPPPLVTGSGEDKPLLVLDFDGVLHSYTSGWQGATSISDPPVPGAQEFCIQALQKFRVWVVSTRCTEKGGASAILSWLEHWGFPAGMVVSIDGKKLPAHITIDDRAFTFRGEWPAIDALVTFQPWHKEVS